MGKSLIITEKPSVAREFAQVLGVNGRQDGYIENNDYVITWCVGHLVGLVYPESYDMKYKKWRLEDLPFLPEEYKYDVIKDVSKQYDIVHGMLMREDIERVYWAGDAGKEGQTIEENIRNFGGVRKGMQELRVWIDSQTQEEILRGIKEAKPMSDYANLGNSGIMRTIEDYAMGINFSRVMSVKYGNLLNRAAGTKSYTAIAVGRVMTCVLGMVVIREREIRDFKETPFYRVIGKFTDAEIEGEWKAVEGSSYFASPLLYKENGFREEKDAEELIGKLDKKTAVVKSIEKSISKKRAPLLFNLAELQAECAKRFKISPDETLQVAQDLYEKKLTTYPRTDARVLSSAVAKEIHKNISRLHGYAPTAAFADKIMAQKLYANIAKSQYVDDSKITDHYAIIPTGQLTEYNSLNQIQKAIYELIVRRFLSIFYPPAEYQNVKLAVAVAVDDKTEQFFSSAKILKNPGYLDIAGIPQKKGKNDPQNPNRGLDRVTAGEYSKQEDGQDEEETADPKKLLELAKKLKSGDEIPVYGYRIKEGKTSPPKRYTSGSMVLAMENAGQLIEDEELREQIKGSGIGTSATRAEIIRKLVRIGYLNLNKKTQVLTPENLGEMVYEVVNMTVPALLNPKMTASWEKGLDGITNGTVEFSDYRKKLEDFISTETKKMIEQNIKTQIADKISLFSGKNERVAGSRIGVKCPLCQGEMLKTSFGYGCENYKKTGCRFSIGTIAGLAIPEEAVKQLLTEKKTDTLRGFKSKAGKKFDACLVLAEDEEGKPSVQFDFTRVEARKVKDVKCPVCGGEIVVTPFGFGCANYEKDNPDSCRFSIGKMAEKTITEAQVKKLLNDGITDTIRGFKSKTGKKFDAKIILAKDENGKVSGLKFDFDNIEPKKVKDVVCPKCGGAIVVAPFGFVCENNKRDDPDSCRFMVGKVASVKIKEAQLKDLLLLGKTDVISGFVAKTGMKFDAPLKLTEDGTIAFDFPEKPKPEETKIVCPKCGKLLIKTQWKYECECGFNIWHTVAKVELSEAIMTELFTVGRTKEKVSGFTSKAGNVFDACLKYENEQISFDFEAAGTTNGSEVKNKTS